MKYVVRNDNDKYQKELHQYQVLWLFAGALGAEDDEAVDDDAGDTGNNIVSSNLVTSRRCDGLSWEIRCTTECIATSALEFTSARI